MSTEDKILDIFYLVAPEFEKVKDNDIEAALELYQDLVSKKRFGRFYERAVALLMAHQLKLNQIIREDAETGGDTLTKGNVTSEREGDLQRSYGNIGVTGSDEDYLLQKTIYGRLFLALRKRCIIPVSVRRRGY